MLAANLIWGAISAVVGDRLTVRGDSVTSA